MAPDKKTSGSFVGPELVVTQRVVTGTMTLGDDEVKLVSHDYKDGAHDHIPSSKALYEGLARMQKVLDELDPDKHYFKDNTVITLPLLPVLPSPTTGWQLLHWFSHEEGVTYEHAPTQLDNYVRPAPEFFQTPGYYMLVVDVTRLDVGKLVLQDKNGLILGTIASPGRYCFEVLVTHPESDSFRFSAQGLNPGNLVSLTSIGLHKITSRLRDYLLAKLAQYAGGGSGGVTPEYVDAALAQIRSELHAELIAVANTATNANDGLLYHLQNNNNPHGVTPQQIGAANLTHTHSPDQCGAAPARHTHQPEECGAAPAGHSHTLAALGAAATQHTHVPSECGAAPVEHSHAEYTTVPQVTAIVEEYVDASLKLTHTSGSPLTILAGPVGHQPPGYQEGSLSFPVDAVVSDTLIHATKGAYDFVDGTCATNVPTLETHPIEYAFKKLLDEADYTINVAAFAAPESTLPTPVLLQYTMHTTRQIGALVIRKDLTERIKGSVRHWRFYVDHKLVAESTTEQAHWSDTGAMLRVPLSTPVTGQVLSLVVTEVNLTATQQWGAAVDFEFTDIPSQTVLVPKGVRLAIPDGSSNLKVLELAQDILVTPNLPIEGLPLYLTVLQSPNPQLLISPVRPEFGVTNRGIPALMDYFTTNPHPYWGSLLASSSDVGHPVEELYRSNDHFWRSGAGSSQASLTHIFSKGETLRGYQLVFTKPVIDQGWVPTSWTLQLTMVDGSIRSVAGADVAYYLPDSSQNGFGQAWFCCTFPEAIPGVKQLKLTLMNETGAQVAISKFIPLFTHFYYNTVEGVTYLENQQVPCMPLGSVIYTRARYGWVGYRPLGLVLGKVCNIPLAGMQTLAAGTVLTVANPFLSTNVDLTMCGIKTSQIIEPQATILLVTPDSITVRADTEGKYSLKVHRSW